MIRFFRRLRQRLLLEHKLRQYFFYAIGEILLVVIGILIALQINNQNDLRKDRLKEVHYLGNIKTDLQINLQEMDRYLQYRTECIAAANRVLEHFEGEPITDYAAFNADGVHIYEWERFWQNDQTFQELVNSGNLALISNEAIKTALLDIELLYMIMKSEEDHYRFDTETALYKPLYEMMDLLPMVASYEYHVTGGSSGENVDLSGAYFSDFLKNTTVKNGFVMTVLELGKLNQQMREIKRRTEGLVELIDAEIAR